MEKTVERQRKCLTVWCLLLHGQSFLFILNIFLSPSAVFRLRAFPDCISRC